MIEEGDGVGTGAGLIESGLQGYPASEMFVAETVVVAAAAAAAVVVVVVVVVEA